MTEWLDDGDTKVFSYVSRLNFDHTLASRLLYFCFSQLGALHEVLERLQTKRINPWEKKYGQVPSVSH